MVCSICLEIIDESKNQHLVEFCCRQTYHFTCIKSWTDLKLTCPICRNLLDRNVLNILRTIQNNINELKIREERAQHIIETLLLDIQNVQQRTRNNLEKIANISSYTHPEIPSSPTFSSDNPLSFSRLLERRNAVVLPLIIPSSPTQSIDCSAPAFCRCFTCSLNSDGRPRWRQ